MKRRNAIKSDILNKNDIKRFWLKVSVMEQDKCWEWLSAKNNKGYGKMGVGKKTIDSHRLSYLINKGDIPENYCVCHTCDNPSCVNPNHLFLGTVRENAVDMVYKGRGKYILPPSTKINLKEEEIALIGTMSDKKLGELLNISPHVITNRRNELKIKAFGNRCQK